MDNLSVGNVVSSPLGRNPTWPCVVQRLFFALWKTFRNDPDQGSDHRKSDRLRIESLIGISPES
jgi:hypothetical protein